MFNYFQPWQYITITAGLLCLLSSFIVYKEEKHLRLAIGLLMTGSLLINWFAIHLDPFLNVWDEQYHALVARNCMMHPFRPTLIDNPFYPTDNESWINTHIWLHKQPLFLWQMALSMKIFGINEIALRIPNFIMMTIATFFVFRIGQRTVGNKAGLYSAILFTTLYYVFELSSGYLATDHNDIAFLFYVTASLWAWVEYYSGGKKKWIIWIGVFAGCAILNKWLTGLLVYAVWGSAILFNKDTKFEWRKFLPLLYSFLIACIVFIPWQIYISIKFPIESMIERELNTRHVFEVIEGHDGNQWFHLDRIAKLYNNLVPYLIIPGFISLVKYRKSNGLVIGLISGVVFIYVFFTLVVTKMSAFTLPVAGIFCVALGALFYNLEIALVGVKRWLYILFAVSFTLFFYYNLNMQDIERNHGINKSQPQKNYRSAHRSRDAVFFKEIGKQITNPSKAVIYNVSPFDIPSLMFYTGATCYEKIQSDTDIATLNKLGRPIYYLTRELPDESLVNNKSVNLLIYPENKEISRRKVALKMSNNKFLCAEVFNAPLLIANREEAGGWETFTLIQYQDSSIGLLTHLNRFLNVNLNSDQSIGIGPDKAREWEHFRLISKPNGKYALLDCNNKYVFLKDAFLFGGGKNYTKESEIELVNLSN